MPQFDLTISRPALKSLKVGWLVWRAVTRTKYPRGGGASEVRVDDRLDSRVTHIDKRGRIFVCAPKPELIGNWRYGFDPATGTAKQYEHEQIFAPTPAELTQLEAEQREREAESKREAEFRETQEYKDAMWLLDISNRGYSGAQDLIEKYGADKLRRAVAVLTEE